MSHSLQPVYAQQTHIVQPPFYASHPKGTVFTDEDKILKAGEIFEKYLGREHTSSPISQGSIAAPRNNYLNGQAPITVNFNWKSYRPGFFESLSNLLSTLSKNSLHATQARFDTRTREQKKVDEKEKKQQKEATFSWQVALPILGGLVFGLFYEYGNFSKALANHKLMQAWHSRTIKDNKLILNGYTHPHGQKLEDLAQRVCILTAQDVNSRLKNIVHLTVGIVATSTLFIGGWYVIPTAMSAGWMLMAVTGLAAIGRIAMWCSKDDDENKKIVHEGLNIYNHLVRISGGERLHYYWLAGTTVPKWEYENRINWELQYINTYLQPQTPSAPMI